MVNSPFSSSILAVIAAQSTHTFGIKKLEWFSRKRKKQNKLYLAVFLYLSSIFPHATDPFKFVENVAPGDYMWFLMASDGYKMALGDYV